MTRLTKVNSDPWSIVSTHEVMDLPFGYESNEEDQKQHLQGYYEFLIAALEQDPKFDFEMIFKYLSGVTFITFQIAQADQQSCLLNFYPYIEETLVNIDPDTIHVLLQFIETGYIPPEQAAQINPAELLGQGIINIDLNCILMS